MTTSTPAPQDGEGRLIHREHLLDMAMGDIEFLTELTDLFLISVQEQMHEINQAIQNQDSKRLSQAAHACKGSVGNYTKQEPYALLQTLEHDGKSDQLENSPIVFKSAEKQIAQLTTEIKSIIAQERQNKHS